ncbi:MAG: SUMF1/EgtB/PvdO family nonheme iron enzyme [Fibrobacterota bacterium]
MKKIRLFFLCAGLLPLLPSCSKSPTNSTADDGILPKVETIQTAGVKVGGNQEIIFRRVPALGKHYWISANEITNNQYDAVMGTVSGTAGFSKAVNWFNAARFVNALSLRAQDSLAFWRTAANLTNRADSARLDSLVRLLPAGFAFQTRYDSTAASIATVQPIILRRGAFICLINTDTLRFDSTATTLTDSTHFKRMISDTLSVPDSVTLVTVRTCSLRYSRLFPAVLQDSLLEVALDAGPDSMAAPGKALLLLPSAPADLFRIRDSLGAWLAAADTQTVLFYRHQYATGSGTDYRNVPTAVRHPLPAGGFCDTSLHASAGVKRPGLFVIFKYLPAPDSLVHYFGQVAAHPDTLITRPLTYTVTNWPRQGDDAAYGFRLPSDTEWTEIAGCGQNLTYSTSTGGLSADVAVFSVALPGPAASKPDNPFGMYDMTGNLGEWTENWWTDFGAYDADSVTAQNPIGYPRYVPWKTVKGGSFADSAANPALRVAGGASVHPDSLNGNRTGIRVIIADTLFWQYFRK